MEWEPGGSAPVPVPASGLGPELDPVPVLGASEASAWRHLPAPDLTKFLLSFGVYDPHCVDVDFTSVTPTWLHSPNDENILVEHDLP